jgi:hypothetical protein
MMPPPGSRVISCENVIRPPAITDGPRLLRHTCIHRLSKSRGMVPPPTKRRSPHPASCAQVGRSRFPMGRGAGPGTSRSRIVPSRLHAVVLPVQRLQPEFTPSTRVSGSGADPGAFAGDPLRPMESELHALARRPRGPTHAAPQSRCYGLRRVRRNAAGKARWGKHFGVHRTVRSPFNRVEAPRLINTKSRLQGLCSEPQALLRRPSSAPCAPNVEPGPLGRDSRQAATTLAKRTDSRKSRAFRR